MWIQVFLCSLCYLLFNEFDRIRANDKAGRVGGNSHPYEIMMHTLPRYIAVLSIAIAFCPAARAENVDLSTVPKRDTVQLTIYNSEDITLVRETRVVTFKKGVNPLQFSWANTLIDSSSVELKFLTSADKLVVEDTTFPHDKPQMLYWNVQSELDGEATIQITYFTSGITWSADYIAIADKDESKIDHRRLRPRHQQQRRRVRKRPGPPGRRHDQPRRKNRPVGQSTDRRRSKMAERRTRPLARSSVWPGHGRSIGGFGGGQRPMTQRKKTIIKEGLSEYFIYTVEGTETIPNGWSKRMRSFEGQDVPLKIQYRYRPKEYGDQLVRMYLMTNNTESKLGTTPLPDGMVRVFRNNGRDGLSYLTQQNIKYIPIGDKIELNLGPDPEVVFNLTKMRASRNHIWMQVNGKNTFKEVGGDAAITEPNMSVVGWDDHSLYRQQIRNYTAKPIDVEIRRTFDGHIDFRSQLKPTQFDFQTAQFTAEVKPGVKKDLLYETVQHQGRNAKQNHVMLETAEVK